MDLRIRRLLAALATTGFVSGCGLRAAAAAGPEDVTVVVENPSASSANVHVCPPTACLPPREVAGGGRSAFRFSPVRGTRAVVVAKRGDRVVDQQPVDYRPGERYHVVLDLP